jgi:beta-lactamase superfamily II metal-dependent hydrolase
VPLPELPPDELAVLVFGPGYGELILVRVPPDVWMVVDGCGEGETTYATAALQHYGGRPRIIALTHPHDDHSRGIDEVINSATPKGRTEQWPRIGMVLPDGADGRAGDYIAGVTMHAVAAVRDRWEQHPGCKWEMHAGDIEPLGDASVKVVSPAPAIRTEQLDRWRSGRQINKNVISTALLLTWRDRRVLLGSDLVEEPKGGWTASLTLDAGLGDHDLLKVPHHGSNEALVDGVLRPQTRVPDPLRIVAPFNKRWRLPSFAAGEGVHRINSLGGTTYLTGLPRRHENQSGRAEQRTLAELATHDTITFDPTTNGFPDCYVMVSLPPARGAPSVVLGAGSIAVQT